MIHSRVSWMLGPVERSISVSAPHMVLHCSFSTSWTAPRMFSHAFWGIFKRACVLLQGLSVLCAKHWSTAWLERAVLPVTNHRLGMHAVQSLCCTIQVPKACLPRLDHNIRNPCYHVQAHLLYRAGDSGVPDVGVDLGQEVAP